MRYAGITHPGLIGTAPSADLLARWNKREAELIASDLNLVPPLAEPPNPSGALLGKVRKGTPDFDRIVQEGARTIPGRENGGNCDI